MKRQNKLTSPITAVMRREFERIGTRKTLYMLIIFMPIAIFLTVALIYKNAVVQELPLAVYDNDHSAFSRLIIRNLAANPSFKIAKYVNDQKAIEEAFKRGDIQAAIYIPDNLEKTIKAGKNGQVVFFKNSTNIIVGNVALKAAMTTLRTLSVGIEVKKLQSSGSGKNQALDRARPIRVETVSLYNPAYNYQNYLVAGLLPILYQMVVMISAVLVISAEIKEGTLKELFQTARGSLSALFLGKTLPHILLHACGVLLLVGIVFPLFHIPVHSSTLILIVYLIYFVTAVFFIGMFLSCLFKDMMLATEAAIFISTPAFIFTGYTFPIEAMPRIHSLYAQLLPSTHFMIGYIKLYQMGTPFHYVLPEVLKLTVFLLIGALGTLRLMIRRKKKFCESGNLKTEVAS